MSHTICEVYKQLTFLILDTKRGGSHFVNSYQIKVELFEICFSRGKIRMTFFVFWPTSIWPSRINRLAGICSSWRVCLCVCIWQLLREKKGKFSVRPWQSWWAPACAAQSPQPSPALDSHAHLIRNSAQYHVYHVYIYTPRYIVQVFAGDWFDCSFGGLPYMQLARSGIIIRSRAGAPGKRARIERESIFCDVLGNKAI